MPKLSAIAALVTCLLSSLSASALTVRGVPNRPSEISNPALCTLRATPVAGMRSAEVGITETTELKVFLPGTIQLTLDPAMAWRLEVDGPGLWAPPVVVVAGSAAAEITLWPTAELRGVLEVDRHETLPPDLSVRFESARSEKADGALVRAQHSCEVERERFRCRVPAGMALDVRLRAKSFVSHHLWGLPLRPREVKDLGRLRLERGASLTGFVEAEGKEWRARSVHLTLRPMEAVAQAASEDRAAKTLALEARVDEHGFFSFEGIPPGDYRVAAEHPGFAPAEIFPVSVLRNAETELQKPLILRPPLTLEIAVEPALDSQSQPWAITLLRRSRVSGATQEVADGRAGQNGVFRLPGMSPGHYLALVEDSQGSRQATEELDLEQGSERIAITLPLILVEGRVRLGGEPLAASLLWGGRFGRERIEVQADADGRFEAVLPRAGEWRLFVEAQEPRVAREIPAVAVEPLAGTHEAQVAIDLPASELSGEVVDGEGEPVTEVIVTLLDWADNTLTQVDVDEEGAFSFHGAREGKHTLYAQGPTAESERVDVEIGEEAGFQRLVVRQLRLLAGRVVSSDGSSVPAAAVFVNAYDSVTGLPRPTTVQAKTDASGTFRAMVPEQVSQVQITVHPPGFALRVLPPMPFPEEPLTIVAEREGGTLVLGIEAPEAVAGEPPLMPVVWMSGVLLSAQELSNWARVNGSPSRSRDSLTVPRLPPGSYRACLAPGGFGSLLGASAGGSPAPSEGGGCRSFDIQPGVETAVQLEG